jgi:hypothetical protein
MGMTCGTAFLPAWEIRVRIKLGLLGVGAALWMASCSDATKPSATASGGNAGQGSTASGGNAGQGSAGSSSLGGTAGLGTNVAIDDFLRAYTDGACQLLLRCYAAAATALPPDCTTFLEVRLREQGFGHIEAAVGEGRVDYHGEAVAQCIEGVSTASCDAVLLPYCSSVFVGAKKTGEACTLDFECVDQQCVVDGACPGACAAPGTLGAACTTENRCQPELSCLTDDDTGAGKCVKTAAKGETCSKSVPCRGYTFCAGRDPEVPEDTGVCIDRAGLYTAKQGEPCEAIREPMCEAGLVCTTRVEAGITVGSCQPRVASGSACTFSTPDACPDQEYCRITSETGVKPATGSCKPRPGLGEECRYGSFYVAPCGEDQFCNLDTTLCAESKHLDEPCSIDDECYSNRCSVAGKCVALLECEKSAEP